MKDILFLLIYILNLLLILLNKENDKYFLFLYEVLGVCL